MATLFEPSASFRAPYSTAHSTSVADTLPSINFGFDELRERMAKFTVKFDTFIEAGRKRILEERNQFRMNVAESQEDNINIRKRIEQVEEQAQAHAATLQREAQETHEATALITNLTAQRDAQIAQQQNIQSRISSVHSQISQKQSEQNLYASTLASQSLKDIPELDFWVQNLGLTIQGAGVSDRIKFAFKLVDERDWDREAWFELNCENRDYEVKKFSPKVEKVRVEALVEILNEKRELAGMLRGMRELFAEYFRENR